ncbi:DNA repair protein complementing XP-C cells homolog isoform 1-T1 [Glossina fuscipes fuscipes]
MSDEEDSMSEGFSASEEEWQPNKEQRGGETSDDDDSDFEDIPKPGIVAASGAAGVSKKRAEPKSRSAAKLASSKKRKTSGQSLRAKLYNKYKPPPKTLSPPSYGGNSPSTSNLTRAHPKNAKMPNESNVRQENNENDGSSSDGSIYNYLVNPNEIDLQSSFFNKKSSEVRKSSSPTPVFNCNAGLADLTDSESDLDNEDKNEKEFFNFQNILKNLNTLENTENAKEKKGDAKEIANDERSGNKINAMDVYSVLALGEKQKQMRNEGEDEDDEDEDDENGQRSQAPSKLSKTKSARVKRHTRTRPLSTAAADSDDSDWEEVADDPNLLADTSVTGTQTGNLEIHVALPSRSCGEKKKTQQDLELALKRKLNRDRKDRQLLMHKASLLCRFARCYFYNRLLNDNTLMQIALKLLPNKNAYPPQKGTEIKYYQSLMTWFKTVIKLVSQNLYPEKIAVTKSKVRRDIIRQLKRKEALCKQDMIFMFVVLLRGMGMQCRLIFNMQPLPLKPPQSDLIPIKLIQNDKKPDKMQDSKKSKQSKEPKDASSKTNVSPQSSNSKPKKPTQKKNVKSKEQSPEIPQKTATSQNNAKNSKSSEDETNTGLLSETKSNNKTTNKNIQKNPRLARLKQPRVQLEEVNNEPDSKKSRGSSPYRCPDVLRKENSNENEKKGDEETSETSNECSIQLKVRDTRSRSKSPNVPIISPTFLQTKRYKEKLGIMEKSANVESQKLKVKNTIENKVKISPTFLTKSQNSGRMLRSRTKTDENNQIPQLDGPDDSEHEETVKKGTHVGKKRSNLSKLLKASQNSKELDEDFEPSQSKKIKAAPKLWKKDRRVLSTDEDDNLNNSAERMKRKSIANDIWVEVWCDFEEQWVCIDLFKGKIHCIESIVKSASVNLVYVFAFQNDLTIKDVTARYSANWADVVRKCRVEKDWLDVAISSYLGKRTMRDIKEDRELRRIHEAKPRPTSICDYKNHPFYALERHLLKFQAIYPPNAPVLGHVRGEAVYSRDCVYTLHSREIWLKQARVVKLGEKPYKIVKARPKWDKFTQTVIKDLPLEIFGYWQTEDYDPPTAENGLVPRNAYGNVDLFKPSMLPKKTVHLRLPGLNRVCRKLGIDCANATIGFDFHQGACHPLYDGFVVCEEFSDTVTAAWHQEQDQLERKEREKHETRVYNNWKKLIRGLLIRERIKVKYNF